MTYAIPLAGGSFGIAQAGEAMMPNVIYVAFFVERYRELPLPPLPLYAISAIALAATWRQTLNRGEWISLSCEPQIFDKAAFPNERFAASGYVGARTYDAGILTRFLSAFHGLVPWNVMHDENFYDQLLLPGLERPKSVVLLDHEARKTYRRESFGVDA